MITHTLDVTDGDTQGQVFALRWYHPPRPQAAKPPRQFELRPQDMRFWVASVMPAPKKEVMVIYYYFNVFLQKLAGKNSS